MAWGILATGKMTPDRIFMVRMTRKVMIMDCSWVRTMVDMKMPKPRVEKR